ncbi:MAG: hypothetical protein A2275_18160 [Bacteroidetes bacterium RIFOXYA12_FULL_35_11]|nr:MAG: hypothetical protein A2X01_06960 [Bacteroidetes bacterium GWF2_35_48]OFY72959.1 MAG: hypothetical protein A2275_18160 [Bacteroidetes bacterium RIFOXYA12_FULL_35_11]OFY96465.1 MAG: hypothetical protein A2491_15210 [Bacteroidetes bacterium RIFOXYC12_FULL_35_7]OFY97789.1 MAG: hypothetical protein A2309_08565 [Bacteroidetes bacterium RIFOXYB2_FULL_35_7]
MKNLPFSITKEPILTYQEQPELNEKIEELHYEVTETKGKVVKKIKDLIEKYPHVPVLKNYLAIAYQLKGELDKYEETSRLMVKEHPDYLFGKIQLSRCYLKKKQYNLIPDLFENKFNINELYPERDIFHMSEILSFYFIIVQYFVGIGDNRSAWVKFEILDRAAPDSSERDVCFNLIMKNTAENISKSPFFAKDNSITPKYITPIYDKEKTWEKPVFTHPEIEKLYFCDIWIEKEIIETILSLPRETAIKDLENFIWDSFLGFKRIQKSVDISLDFIIHALFLLTEMGAKESLPVVLEILRQNDEYNDFYFGDMLPDFFQKDLAILGRDKLDVFSSFMKEPNLLTYLKSMVSGAISEIYFHDKERREDVVAWYKEVFEFFIENKKNKNILDTDLLGLMIGDVISFEGRELMPLIKKMYDLKIVNESVSGAYETVEKDINSVVVKDTKKFQSSIFERYDQFIKKWYSNSNNDLESEYQEEDYDETKDYKNLSDLGNTDQEFVKAGRNDPCPCGSGKKYKKCCLGK